MIELRLLGGLEIAGPDRERGRSILMQPRRAALLVYLAARNYHGLERREHLAQMFFPDAGEDAARLSLRQALAFVRRALGEQSIVARNSARGQEEVGIDPIEIRCDVSSLERYFEAGDFARADEIYRGELLSGFSPTGLAAFEHWLDETRDHYRRRMREGLHTLSQREAAAGNTALAVQWARRELALEPIDESAALYLMRCLADDGSVLEALEVYEGLVALMKRELDDEPTDELRTLAEQLRAMPAKPVAPDVTGPRKKGPVRSGETTPAIRSVERPSVPGNGGTALASVARQSLPLRSGETAPEILPVTRPVRLGSIRLWPRSRVAIGVAAVVGVAGVIAIAALVVAALRDTVP